MNRRDLVKAIAAQTEVDAKTESGAAQQMIGFKVGS